ncbi:MAG: cupin domain-containing protein [Verrucomicrobiaceae bacterium]
MPALQNLFSLGPGEPGSEHFLTLFESSGVKIERIVSHSAASPAGFWYDQENDEWVIVLKGVAELRFIDGRRILMCEGDYLLIPKHEKHRVESTVEKTIWLAVYLKGT